MEAKELRGFSVEDLKGRVRTWNDELFRARFKGQNSETKDTSVFRKLRRDVARALTIIGEKEAGTERPVKAASAPVDKPVAEAKTAKAKKTTKGSKA